MTLDERCALILECRHSFLDRIFARHPCFICVRFGWCDHREPEVEMAELAAAVGRKRA